MKSITDVKLKYLIDKLKVLFSLKSHTHDDLATKNHTHTGFAKGDQDGNAIHALSANNLDKNSILSVSNGGTGVSTESDLKNLIRSYGTECAMSTYKGDGQNTRDILYPTNKKPTAIIIIPTTADTAYCNNIIVPISDTCDEISAYIPEVNKSVVVSVDSTSSEYYVTLSCSDVSVTNTIRPYAIMNAEETWYYYICIG